MRPRRLLALLALFALTPTTVWPQTIDPRRVFGRYQQFLWNDRQGLPENAVTAITRTRDGYLWLGTAEGAARFDGVRFTTFNRFNTPALRDSVAKTLLEDRHGVLWLGTEAGLARMQDGRFTVHTRESGLSDDNISSIVEAGDGGVWAGTYRGGIVRVSDDRFTAITTADGLPHNQVWALERDPNGSLWVATSAGLAKVTGDRVTTYTVADGLPDDQVRVLDLDREGQLWVGTARGLVALRDGRFDVPDALASIDAPITAFLEDDEGALWIGTKGAGVYRFAGGRLDVYRAADGLPGDDIASLYQDPDGDVWIGTNGWGVVQLRTPLVHTVTTQDGLPHNTVRAIMEDRDGAMWIGTDDGLTRIAAAGMTTYSAADGLVGGVVALGQDDVGEIWVGMWRGISRLRRGRFEMVPELASQVAVAMLADRAGTFWIGTAGGGLFHVRDGRFDTLRVEDGLPANEVIALHQDRAGALWIGTFNGGMSRLDHGRLTTWTTKDGLASNYILAFCEDADGTMWIGTHGGGLHRFKDGRFRVIATTQGLYDNLAFRVLDDGGGNLWMLANRGIYRATLASLNAVTDGSASTVSSFAYDVSDGMISREGNGGGPPAVKARDGRLWFATMGGAVAIDPATRNHRPPLVAIEAVTIDRQPVPDRRAIELLPGQANVEIHYTGLSWRRPQQIQFRYRLYGLDHDWVEAGTRRTAYYSYLPPGRYTFQVIADNGDGVWNLEGQTLTVNVIPAFYARWWFAALAAASMVLTAAFAGRYWVRRLRERQAIQETFARQLIASQESERKRIAAELHDGLGQRLLLIKNLTLLSLSEPGHDDERQQRLESISDGASDAIREVREIAYNLRPYQLDRLGLTLALEAIVETAAESSSVTFTTAIDNVDDLLAKDAEINLYRVVQECVNNIVKHADATEATVTVRQQLRQLHVAIADNGRGFDATATTRDPRQGGFGLLGLSERVHLLGGTVQVTSAPGRGTALTIEIGLGAPESGRKPTGS